MEVSNIVLALRLSVSLAQEVSRLVENAQGEGRDITDAELEALRQQSRASLDEWLSLPENAENGEGAPEGD